MEKTKNGSKAVAKQETKEITSVDNFIQQAIASGAPVETLEKLFALHKEVKADNAKTAFVEALTKFQADCPIIEKTKDVLNKDGRTIRYSYAPIDSVVKQIKKTLSDSKLSYSWDVELKEKHMKVSCKLTHILGHSETSSLEIPITEAPKSRDGYSLMSQPQTYATAQTYAKRYTLLNVLGIATAEEDDDAISAGKDAGPKNIKASIMTNLKALGQDIDNTTPKEEIAKAVKNLTQLDLVEKNYQEINNRLSVKITERNEA